MQVDISFPFAKIYNVEKVDVVQGQKFTLLTDGVNNMMWFANNDPVLAISVNGSNADIDTTEVGESKILIMDSTYAILKKIFIKVIAAPATDLGLSADQPELK